MSNKTNFEVTGVDAAMATLRERSANIVTTLTKSMARATIDLVAYIKGSKLSDQVLRVRTGRLRRSITQRVEDTDGKIVGITGTNVSYARAHELGFKGTVQVKAYTRTVKGASFPVRSHKRNLDIKARPFLAPSLQERFPKYEQQFAKAVEEGSRGVVS